VPFLPFLLSFEFDTDQALQDIARAAGHIAVVLVAALIALWLTQRVLTPVLRVAIREHMGGQPEIEVKKRIDTLSHVLYTTIWIAVAMLAVVTILPEFGINAGPLIAGLGLVGLAVGFGAQNLVKDMINGLFILIENQYGVGDVVTVAGISGLVEDMNLRRTVLRDLDGVVHFIPHSQVDTASNFTRGYSRVNLNVRVGYESDIDKVFTIIDRAGEEMARDPEFGKLIKSPPKALRVDDFAESGIEVKIVGETEPIEQWTVAGELRRRLKKAFDAEGISIALPQRIVHASGLEDLLTREARRSQGRREGREDDGTTLG
jgi:small-conductance mechanosensitive channel